MHEDAVALAEDFDRADARAGAAEDVLGEDRARGAGWIPGRDGGDEARHVDACRARDHARCGRLRPTALEATVGLDNGRGR